VGANSIGNLTMSNATINLIGGATIDLFGDSTSGEAQGNVYFKAGANTNYITGTNSVRMRNASNQYLHGIKSFIVEDGPAGDDLVITTRLAPETGNSPLTYLRKKGAGRMVLGGIYDNNSLLMEVVAGTAVLGKNSSSSVHALGGNVLPGLTIYSGARAELGGTGGDQIFTQIPVTIMPGGVFDTMGLSEGWDDLIGGGLLTNSVSSSPSTISIGENNASCVYNGQVAGAISLSKAGTGIIMFDQALTYTGPTIISGQIILSNNAALVNTPSITLINGGCLNVNPTTSGSYTFASGRTISGLGIMAGNIVMASGSALVPGGNTALGTLAFTNSLTVNGGATLFVELSNPNNIASNDVIQVNDLNLSGSINVVLSFLGGVASTGEFTIVKYSGKLTGGAANLVANSRYPNFTFSDAIPGEIRAVLTDTTSTPGNLTWQGSTSDWDIGVSQNWFGPDMVTLDNFFTGDNVAFTDAVTGSQTVNIPGQVAPSTLIVSNATKPFTFTSVPGAGIAGNTKLIKRGDSSLTLEASDINFHTGGTFIENGMIVFNLLNNFGVGPIHINGGTVRWATDNAVDISTRSLTVSNNGAFFDLQTNDVVFGGAFGNNGTGVVNKAGSGTLTYLLAPTYQGDTIVSAGTLQIGNNNLIPDGAGRGLLNIASGARFDLNGFSENVNGITGLGTIESSVAGSTNTLTVGGNNTNSSFAGTLQNGAGLLALTKIGTGSLNLSGAVAYSELTTVNGGTLVAGRADVISNSVMLLLTNSANSVQFTAGNGGMGFDLAGFNQSLRSIAGPGFITNSVGTPVTLILGAANADSFFEGVIAGATLLTKDGLGTLVLNNFNTYNQGTIINAGKVNVGFNHGLGSGPVTLAGGTLASGGSGLKEGRVTGANNFAEPILITSVQPGTRWAHVYEGASGSVTAGAWINNSVYIYSGYLNNTNDTNVTWTFAEGFDDSAYLRIDGNVVLTNTGSAFNTRSNYTMTPGLHTFELRLSQGSGGLGPNGNGGALAFYGFSVDTQGRNQSNGANFTVFSDLGDGAVYVPNAEITLTNAIAVNANSSIDVIGLGGKFFMNGPLSGSSTLNKIGKGALYVRNFNTFAGTINVLAGSLICNTLNTNSSAINLLDRAGLGAQVGGAASTLKLNGSLTFAAGGTNTMDFVFGSLANPTVPVMEVGTLTPGNLVVVNINGQNLTAGTTITLIKYSSLGNFSAFALSNLPPHMTATLVDNSVNSSIDLNITAAESFVKWNGTLNANWDINATLNWLGGSSGMDTNYTEFGGMGDNVLFDGSALGGTTVNLLNNMTPSSITVSNLVRAYTLQGARGLMGSGTFTKRGFGTNIMSTPNTFFDGDVNIDDGVLRLGHASALGTTNGVTRVTGNGTLDIYNLIVNKEIIVLNGDGFNRSGALINGAAQGGALESIKVLRLEGNSTIGGVGRWDLTGTLDANGYRLTKMGANEIWLSPQTGDTGLGELDVREGVQGFEGVNFNVLGDPAKRIAVYPGATLAYWALNNLTAAMVKPVAMTNATFRNQNGSNFHSGVVTLSGTNNFDVSGSTLVLLDGVTGPGNLRKISAGALALAGTNTYAGYTLVEGGAIALLTNGTFAGSTVINISAGASLVVTTRVDNTLTVGNDQYLGGNGDVIGNVTVAAGGHLIPGGNGAPGTLNVQGDLAMSSGSEVILDLADITDAINNDGVSVANVALNGPVGVGFYFLNGTPALDTPYVIIRYAGNLTGVLANLENHSRYGAYFSNNVVGQQIMVVFTNIPAQTSLVWQGDGSGNLWDYSGTTNWLRGVTPDLFYNGDNVLFDDTGSAIPAISLAGALAPNSVVFNAATKAYTLGGSGSLKGNLTLAKLGSADLTVTANNEITGIMTNNVGTMYIGNGGTEGGLGSGDMVNNGTLVFNRTDTNAATMNISGPGNLVFNGSSTTILSGDNSHDGTNTINSGVLRLGRNAAVGSAVGPTIIKPGTTLDLGGQLGGNMRAETYYVSGNGVNNGGAIVNNGGAIGNADGLNSVVLLGDTTVGAVGSWVITPNPNTAFTQGRFVGNGYNLTKVGFGQVGFVWGMDTDLGDINVNQGTLMFDNSVILGRPNNTITVRSNAMLRFHNAVTNQTKNLVLDSGQVWHSGTAFEFNLYGTKMLYGENTIQADISSFYFRGPVAGPGVITKTGAGSLMLFETNTFTGGIIINAGVLRTYALGLGYGSVFMSGGTLAIQQPFSGTVTNFIGGAAGTVTVSDVTPADTVITFDTQIAGGLTHNINNGTSYLIRSNAYSGGSVLGNSGKLRLAHNNSAGTGAITAGGGAVSNRLELVNNITVPNGYTLGARSILEPHIVNVSGNNTLSGLLTITTGGSFYIIDSESGLLTLNGGFTRTSTTTNNRAFHFRGAGNGVLDFGITNNDVGLLLTPSVTKSGSGTWTFNGTNTYRGSTIIQQGTLALGPNASISNSIGIEIWSNATLNASALSGGLATTITNRYLVGGGTLNGSLSVANNNLIAVGGSNQLATMTVTGDMTFNGGVNTEFELGSGNTVGLGVNDFLNVVGTVYVIGGNNIVLKNYPQVPGTYTLIRSAAGIDLGGGGMFNLVAPANSAFTYTLDIQATEVQLTVTGTAGTLTWNPTSGAPTNWDFASLNFKDSSALDALFANGLSVLFDDVGGVVTNWVNLSVAAFPAIITVNATTNYTFVSANTNGSLNGAAALIKSGTGMLTISNANNFYGPVTVNAGGTLRLGHALALGANASPLTINPGGTLDLNALAWQHRPVVVSGAGVDGLGAIVNNTANNNNGPTNVTLIGDTVFGGNFKWDVRGVSSAQLAQFKGNNYKLIKVGTNGLAIKDVGNAGLGNIAVQEGELLSEGETYMGSPSYSITVVSNGAFTLYNNNLTVTNDRAIFLTNGIFGSRAGNNTYVGPITLDGYGAINVIGTLDLRNAVSGNGTFIKYGTGTLIVSNLSSVTGPIMVTNGLLILSNSVGEAISSGSQVYVTNAAGGQAQLRLGNSNQIPDNMVVSVNTTNGDARFQLQGNDESIAGLSGTAPNIAGINNIIEAANDGTVGAAATLTLNVPDGTSNYYSGYMRDGTGTGVGSRLTLIKDGAGTQTLAITNANGQNYVSYSGATIIKAGVLELAGDGVGNNSLLNLQGGTVMFNGGGTRTNAIIGTGNLIKDATNVLTLSGSNNFNGTTYVNNGKLSFSSVSVVPGPVLLKDGATLGVDAIPGVTLNLGALTVGELDALPTALDMNVVSNLTPTVPLVNITSFTNNVVMVINLLGTNLNGTNFSVGQRITLIKYSGGINGLGAQFELGSTPLGIAGNLDNNLANQSIDFVVTASGRSLAWNANVNTTWDINTTANWINQGDGFNTTYQQGGVLGDAVLFDDRTLNTTLNLTTDVKPALVTINTIGSYSIGGAGRITGGAQVTKLGAGTLALTSVNDYTNMTTVSAGTLTLGNLAALPLDVSTARLVNNGTVQLAATNETGSLALNARITGSGTFAINQAETLPVILVTAITNNIRLDAGTLVVSNSGGFLQGTLTQNTGVVNVVNGSVARTYNLNTGSVSVAGGSLLGPLTVATGQVTITSGTVQNNLMLNSGNIAYNGGTFSPYNFTLGSNGNLTVQLPAQTNNATFTASSGSTMNIGAGNTNHIYIGTRGAIATNKVQATFDASLASQMNANVGVFALARANVSAMGGVFATVLLATNNNIVAATEFVIGDHSSSADLGIGANLVLGSGSNYIATPVMTVGYRKTTVGMFLTNGGTLRLEGTNDTRAALYVARNDAGTGSRTVDVLDLSGGAFRANLSSWYIGYRNGTGVGTATGIVNIGTSPDTLVDANEIYLGRVSATDNNAAAGFGSLTMSNGIINVQSNINLGWLLTNGISVGVLNLNGGTLSVMDNILGGTNVGTNLSTSTFILDGGTLDMLPAGDTNGSGSIGIAPNLVNDAQFLSGTLRNVGEYNGGASMAKVGTGTLILAGTNLYTGSTLVSNGTLQVDGVLANNANGILVFDTGTLNGNGIISRPVTINSGGTMAVGGSTIGNLTVNGTVSFNPGATNYMRIDKSNPLSNDVITAASINPGGTLVVRIVGGTVALGEVFKLYNTPSFNGFFAVVDLPVLGGGLEWDQSTLIVNGTIKVVSSGTPPTWLVQPINITANFGSNVTMLAFASGIPEPTYTWYKVGSATPVSTTSNLVLNTVKLADAGNYYAMAYNAAGTITSTTNTLTVLYTMPPAVETILGNSSIGFTLTPETNHIYFLQYKLNLLDVSWTELAGSRMTNTTGVVPIELKDAAATQNLKFYRIGVEPYIP
jgi:autotransporter-associated beta strand protein